MLQRPVVSHPWAGECSPFLSHATTGFLYSLTERCGAKLGINRGLQSHALSSRIKHIEEKMRKISAHIRAPRPRLSVQCPQGYPDNVLWLRDGQLMLSSTDYWFGLGGNDYEIAFASYRWDDVAIKNRSEFSYESVYSTKASVKASPSQLQVTHSEFLCEVLDWLSQASYRGIKALWVDQLCLNQQSPDIMKHVARHSEMYGFFGVAVVSPRAHKFSDFLDLYRAQFARGWILSETKKGNNLVCFLKRRINDEVTVESCVNYFVANPSRAQHDGPSAVSLFEIMSRAEDMIPGARQEPVCTAIRVAEADFTQESDRAVVTAVLNVGISETYLDDAQRLYRAISLLRHDQKLAGKLGDLAIQQAMTIRATLGASGGHPIATVGSVLSTVRRIRGEIDSLVSSSSYKAQLIDFARLIFLGCFDWDVSEAIKDEQQQLGKDLGDMLTDFKSGDSKSAAWLHKLCRRWTISIYAWNCSGKVLPGRAYSSFVQAEPPSPGEVFFVTLWSQAPDGSYSFSRVALPPGTNFDSLAD